MAESEAQKEAPKVAGNSPESDWEASRTELEEFAKSSDRVALLLQVLERGLSGDPDETTFGNVRDSGILLAGGSGFSGLVWASDDRDIGSNIKSLELSPDAEQCVTKILALHGPNLRAALHKSDVPASRGDDWEGFAQTIHWDELNEEHVVSTEIVKFNGEALTITAGLPSAIRLIGRMASSLSRVRSFNSLADADRTKLETSVQELLVQLQNKANEASD